MSTQTRTVQQLFDLTGQTALITGGSRGLGLQMAHALGEAGARLIISSRKGEDLEKAAAELRAANIDVSWIAANVGDEADNARLASEALERLGHIDILVNNAGATWGAPAEDYPPEAWDKVMNLNVRGLFLLTKEIGKRSMIPRGYGRILNIASIAALGGGSLQALAYNTSKGAVVTFTRALATEWGHHNITVNAICPGLFPSKMSKGLMEKRGTDEIIKKIPLQRVGDDEDMKGAALLFTSAAGKHITGQFLPIDGGVSALTGTR